MFPSKSLFPSHLQLVHGNKQQLPPSMFYQPFANDSFYLSEFHQPKDGYESVKKHPTGFQSKRQMGPTGNEPS